jgi:hypothetical protein
LRHVTSSRSPSAYPTICRVRRQSASHTQTLLAFFATKDQSSSSSKTYALGSCGSGSIKVVRSGGSCWAFFQPFNHRTPRYTKNTLDATQTGAFLIGTENFFASFGRIRGELRMVAALAATAATEVLLFAVWCHSIFDKGRMPTMTAGRLLGGHVSSLSCIRFLTMIPCHSTSYHYPRLNSAGVRYPRLLCGRSSLCSRRYAPHTTRASATVWNAYRFRHSSRTVPLNRSS